MLNDFIPVIHKFPLSEHPHGLTIIPLADAHYGSQEFNEVRWHNTLRRIQDDPHCYFVLVGDLIENRIKTSPGSVFEVTASPSEQKEWLYNELKPYGSKLLAAVGGNHERRSKETDDDPLYDVLCRLGKEDVYRPNICFMQLRLTYPLKNIQKQRHVYSFAITHGAGGGQYIGSSANKVQNFGSYIEGIDCLITGHTHKPVAFPVSKLVLSDGMVRQRQFVVAVASSFIDYGGYPVQKMLPPTAHTMTEILLEYNGDDRKELHVKQ